MVQSSTLRLRSGWIKVGFSFVDDGKMKKVKKNWFDKEETTDVVTFPLDEDLPGGIYLLGEIVVNFDQAKKQAKEYKVSLREEIARLITHGALHLLGFDDRKSKNRLKMRNLQEKIVHENFPQKTP